MPFTTVRNAAFVVQPVNLATRAIFRSHVRLYGTCAVACLCLATGCSNPTGPTSGPDFTATRTTARYPAPTPDVATGPGSVSISGVLFTSTPCYKLSATSSSSGSTLTVRITAQSTLRAGDGCAEALQAFSYKAVSHVTPGAVEVVLIHNYSGSAGDVILDKSVTVP
ncbi:MAG: hypothetical protein ACR2MQ_16910 [Gemmatimonadaceae bacterium]